MANYCAMTRSNYFRVKDVDKFKKWCAEVDVEVWERPCEAEANVVEFAISSKSENGWPNYRQTADNEDEVEEFEIFTELAPHLDARDVAILQEVGNEKLRYLAGYSIAVRPDGSTVCVDIDQIYDRALEGVEGDLRVTGATY